MATAPHLRLNDFRVCVQELFNLGWVDVLPSSDDHVLNPALNTTVAACIHAANVTAYNIR